MFEDEIGKINSRLVEELADTLIPETASEYQQLWGAGVRLLADRGDDKRAFFRDTLILTIKLNRRFSVSAQCGNRLRRIILDTFMEGDNTVESQLESYSEQISSVSQLQEPQTRTAKHIVFEAILSELARQFDIRFNVEGALKQELAANIASLSIPSRSKMVLERWATVEPFMGSFDRIIEDDMRLILDQIYSFLCDEWGPSDADSMISDVIARVELKSDAKRFSPRLLL